MTFAISRRLTFISATAACAAFSVGVALAAPTLKPAPPGPGPTILQPAPVIQPVTPQPNVALPSGSAPAMVTPTAVLGQVFLYQNHGRTILGESKSVASLRVPSGNWLVIARFDALMSDKLSSTGVVRNAGGACFLNGGLSYVNSNSGGPVASDATEFATEFLYEPASDQRPTGNQNVHKASFRLPVSMMAVLSTSAEGSVGGLSTITLNCGSSPQSDVSLTNITLTAIAMGSVTSDL